VVRFRLWLATAFALGAIAGSLLRGQVSNDEEKSADESGKSQHETHASSPTPKKSPKPVAKTKTGESKSTKKRSASPTLGESPRPIPKATLATKESSDKTDTPATQKESSHSNKAKKSDEEDEGTPRPKPAETPESTVSPKKSKKSPSPTPKPKGAKKTSQKKSVSGGKKAAKGKSTGKKAKPKPEKTPTPPPEKPAEQPEDSSPSPPRAFAVPTPARSQQAKVPGAVPPEERAQVVIEKSGIEEDQGLEPPPSPPARRGFWPWSLGRPREYRYLTRSVIEEIRRAPVKRRRWQFIVVHNSGTQQGNARAFDYYHRHVRRMPNGLAYHFVIGNGTSSGNGQIEVGDRWRRQINGGHVHSDYLNNISLGICLVGDFNRDQPTRAQLESCEELIRNLRERCGKVGMRSIIVKPHREMNPPRWPTDCPGDVFPYSWFRRF
jgi:N-acetylmuramoyl-L-alanine amidase.